MYLSKYKYILQYFIINPKNSIIFVRYNVWLCCTFKILLDNVICPFQKKGLSVFFTRKTMLTTLKVKPGQAYPPSFH